MAAPIGVQVILCDAAQSDSQSGKVHMLGAGWSSTGKPTGPMAVAVLIKVPPDRANEPIPLTLSLVDSDDHTVEIATSKGDQQVRASTTIQAGPPAWAETGTCMDASFALNIPPLPLEPGHYEWRAEVGDQSHVVRFTVRGGAG